MSPALGDRVDILEFILELCNGLDRRIPIELSPERQSGDLDWRTAAE